MSRNLIITVSLWVKSALVQAFIWRLTRSTFSVPFSIFPSENFRKLVDDKAIPCVCSFHRPPLQTTLLFNMDWIRTFCIVSCTQLLPRKKKILGMRVRKQSTIHKTKAQHCKLIFQLRSASVACSWSWICGKSKIKLLLSTQKKKKIARYKLL